MKKHKRPKIYLVLYLYFFLLPLVVKSQDPFYINYDTNDGLPSSETYYAHADTNGLIWIATDRGICTYDGYKFSTYTTKEGLSHNTNFRIFNDRKNRLWFTAWDGSMTLYEDGKFTAIPLNEDPKYNEEAGHAMLLLFDDQNNIFITKNQGSRPRNPGEIFHLDDNDFSVKGRSIFDFEESIHREKGEILVKIGDEYLYYDEKNRFSVNAEPTDTLFSDWLIGFQDRIKYFRNGVLSNVESTLEYKVNNFFLDPKGDLWLCTGVGLLLYENANLEMPPRHFFKGLEVTSILIDREGNYWMTSREKGVFWIPSFRLRSMLRPKESFEIQQILSIGELPNFLLFGTVNNGIVAVDKQFNLMPELKGWSKVNEKRRMYPAANTYYANKFSRIEDIDGRLKASEYDFNSKSYFVRPLKNGLLFSIHHGSYGIYSKNKSDFASEYYNLIFSSRNKKTKGFGVRLNCIEEGEDVVWLGGLEGLYELPFEEFSSNIPQKDTSKLTNVRIQDIISLDSQRLWLATIGNGLVFKNGNHSVRFLPEDGLSSNMVNIIYLENDSTLWAGTNEGLDKIHFQEEGNGIKIKSISNFSTSDGLVSNFINDLAIWEGHLWVATNKGMNYFYPNEMIENKVPPLIYIESVMVGNVPVDEKSTTPLKHDENNVIINFLGVSFKKPENKSFYRYRLKHDDNKPTWYYTNNKSVRFFDLAPGYYSFEVAAQNKSGCWSKQSAIYSFQIKPHFSEEPWFIITAALLVSLLLIAGFLYRIKILQNREEQKRKLQGAELAGLRNQMNPHFLFNSLNSIQSFIFHKDVKNANHYLSKFSRLMRNSLEYSKLEYISINEEVKFIRSYLDLEKLRFEDRFKIRIEIDPEIPIYHFFIPPLLLQPILENSVKHAFKNINYQGEIDIRFLTVPQKEMIQVIICDNGKGFETSDENRHETTHKSMGLSIIKNRIKLLNFNKKGPKASFKISNRYNAQQEIIGTEASFIIPIQIIKND